MIYLVYILGWMLTGKSPLKYVFWGLVVNPISIFQVCQHGQFDILASLSILGGILFVVKWHSSNLNIGSCACAIIGVGVVIKIVPVFVVPLLFFKVKQLSWADRCLGIFLVFGPIIFGLSILASVAYAGSFERSLIYRSTPGYFGVSGLLFILGKNELAPTYSILYNLMCSRINKLISANFLSSKHD